MQNILFVNIFALSFYYPYLYDYKTITYMDIENRLCEIYGIDKDVLYTNDRHRKRNEIECLHFLWYFLHYHEGYSSLQIARKYKKTPRNVKKAIAKIKFGIETQLYYQDIYECLKGQLY